jgi:hypothetical protein
MLDGLQPFPGDESRTHVIRRFDVEYCLDAVTWIHDRMHGTSDWVCMLHFRDRHFDLGGWFARQCAYRAGMDLREVLSHYSDANMRTYLNEWIDEELKEGAPYSADLVYRGTEDPRFEIDFDNSNLHEYQIKDNKRRITVQLSVDSLVDQAFDLQAWYAQKMCDLRVNNKHGLHGDYNVDNDDSDESDDSDDDDDDNQNSPPHPSNGSQDDDTEWMQNSLGSEMCMEDQDLISELELNGVQVPRGSYAALQRNAAMPKDFTRTVPKPVVIVVHVNGHPARALLDSGSLGDFMSTSLADQLKVQKVMLQKPLSLQLVVQGSRSKVNWGTTVHFKYQSIDKDRYFDITNLSNYDLILGTPWLFAHQTTFGLNPTRVIVGSNMSKPLQGNAVTKIVSRAMDVLQEEVLRVREELIEYAQPLCKEMEETDLPPLRLINHEILLIDKEMIYPW